MERKQQGKQAKGPIKGAKKNGGSGAPIKGSNKNHGGYEIGRKGK